MVQMKRAYEPALASDGCRVLVDRLWPRGVSKERAQIALWLREAAPSDPLRKWFAHDLRKWPEFQRRYRAELKDKTKALDSLRQLARTHRVVTLIYAAADPQHNNAAVLAGRITTPPVARRRGRRT